MTQTTETAAGRPLRAYYDFHPGETGDLGAVSIGRDDVIAFASQWDPQPFHLDEAAGAASPLGGLAASGWHTASLLMRLIADGLLNGAKSMGSGGVRDLRWHRPVRPGETLAGRYEVLSVRPSSRGDRGYVDMRFALVGADGEPATSYSGTVIVGA